MSQRHHLERRARAAGHIWDGEVPETTPTGYGSEHFEPTGQSYSPTRYSDGKDRPSWDNASELSIEVIEKTKEDESYDQTYPESTPRPEGNWVILEREISDPLNCVNATCIFRKAKITEMTKLLHTLVSVSPPKKEYHGFAEKFPGRTTLDWVQKVYQRLCAGKILEGNTSESWDRGLADMRAYTFAVQGLTVPPGRVKKCYDLTSRDEASWDN